MKEKTGFSRGLEWENLTGKEMAAKPPSAALYLPQSNKQSPSPPLELFDDAGARGHAGSSFTPTHLKSHD
jgi:hypothetical protein